MHAEEQDHGYGQEDKVHCAVDGAEDNDGIVVFVGPTDGGMLQGAAFRKICSWHSGVTGEDEEAD